MALACRHQLCDTSYIVHRSPDSIIRISFLDCLFFLFAGSRSAFDRMSLARLLHTTFLLTTISAQRNIQAGRSTDCGSSDLCCLNHQQDAYEVYVESGKTAWPVVSDFATTYPSYNLAMFGKILLVT